MNIKLKKLFGSGLQIAILSTVIGLVSLFVEFNYNHFSDFQIPFHKVLAIVFFLLWLALFVYSFISLPNKQKGNDLITDGVYKYVRHPMYAAFLLFFYMALVFYFQSYMVLIAQIISIFVSGKIVDKEEEFMKELFGDEYIEYSNHTKRFIPFIY